MLGTGTYISRTRYLTILSHINSVLYTYIRVVACKMLGNSGKIGN